MNGEAGYIKLFRSLLTWRWYHDQNVCRLWIHLLLSVNHAEGEWQNVMIHPGQHITSISRLSEETGLSPKMIRTAINKLKSTNEMAIKTTNKYSLITIENWALWQIDEGKGASKRASDRANEGQTKGKQRATNKNDKNDKQGENPPTPRQHTRKSNIGNFEQRPKEETWNNEMYAKIEPASSGEGEDLAVKSN